MFYSNINIVYDWYNKCIKFCFILIRGSADTQLVSSAQIPVYDLALSLVFTTLIFSIVGPRELPLFTRQFLTEAHVV